MNDVSAFVLPSSSSTSVVAIRSPSCASPFQHQHQSTIQHKMSTESTDTDTSPDTTISKAPSLNGKVILPLRALTSGLQNHKVPAVYAILNSNYKRGSGEGWEHVQHVSITKDLSKDINYYLEQKGKGEVAHVRAMSFSYPQKAVMEDFATGWRGKVMEVTGEGIEGWGMVPQDEDGDASGAAAAAVVSTTVEGSSTIITVNDDYEFDEDDEDDMDEDDLDDYLQMMAESRAAVSTTTPAPAPLFVDNTGLSTGIVSLAPEGSSSNDSNKEEEDIISPFDKATNEASAAVASAFDSDTPLELNVDNVDKVLDEVRPYLISDGGNVSVQQVNTASEGGNVYLLLEGACGSCASSTVTMKMGIERVLKEKFGDDLGEVIQVDPDEGDGDDKPTELTIESVQSEVNRISTAIVAMGGVVRVVDVDPIGEVTIDFRGPNRVKKGLELALLDVEFVKHVKFVSSES